MEEGERFCVGKKHGWEDRRLELKDSKLSFPPPTPPKLLIGFHTQFSCFLCCYKTVPLSLLYYY